MSLREIMSTALKEAKIKSGLTYDDIVSETGLAKTSIRYALNGGNNIGLNIFEKLFEFFNLKCSFKENK